MKLISFVGRVVTFLFVIKYKSVWGEQDDLDIVMNEAMARLDVRGASIAYFDEKNQPNGPVLRGYGHVSSSEDSEAVTPDTVFMLASVSKLFAGTAVLILVDRGIITLDDDICDVLPQDWYPSACRNPYFPNKTVTWRMIVTHRSSLREDIPFIKVDEGEYLDPAYGPTGGYSLGSAAGQTTCPIEDTVGFYRDFLIDKETETEIGADLNINWYELGEEDGGAWEVFEPGSGTLYSNFATGYLAVLVEFASGENFTDFCRDNIFIPLGMNNTAWFRRDLPEGIVEAVPVEFWGRKKGFQDVGHYCFVDYASGSLRTSARDLAKFMEDMLDYGKTILSPKSGLNAVTCQARDEFGVPLKDCEFGVNWILGGEFGGADHSGAEAGVQTQVVLFPKQRVYSIVLTNTDLNDEWAAQKLTYDIFDVLGYSAAWRQPVWGLGMATFLAAVSLMV